jgi:hypothetical protein
MQRRNIEFTEDAIRQKIDLSPIEKYIRFSKDILGFSLQDRQIPLESRNLCWIVGFYNNSSC